VARQTSATTDRAFEAALTAADVRRVLSICSPRGLLVGGQALAFWADHLGVAPPPTLSSGVTADADFIGDSRLARDLARALGWELWIPSIDDATPHTAKVTRRLRDGSVKQIDFLAGVVGLDTRGLRRRAIELSVPDVGLLRVIRPVDVLDSRIQNLHVLAEKRDAAGIAQAGLAVDVVRAWMLRELAEHGEQSALKLLEWVAGIALEAPAVRVFLLFEVDPLAAVPVETFRTTTALHSRRWPQVVREVEAQRAILRASRAGRRGRTRST
jgi:hypothetical protein